MVAEVFNLIQVLLFKNRSTRKVYIYIFMFYYLDNSIGSTPNESCFPYINEWSHKWCVIYKLTIGHVWLMFSSYL